MIGGRLLSFSVAWRRLASTKAAEQAKMMQATIDAYGEGATCMIEKEAFSFLIDEPLKLGGRGLAPNPLTYMLGSLAACTQYTLTMMIKERKYPPITKFQWHTAGEYDLRGVRGIGDSDARFQHIKCHGLVETDASQEELDNLAKEVESRCIVAATLRASGMNLDLSLEKGSIGGDDRVERFQRLIHSDGETGKVNRNPGAESDSPKFAGTAGSGAPKSRGYHSSVWPLLKDDDENLKTSQEVYGGKDGEDVAREHLNADEEPQLQKETSEQGSKWTAGGAYASRDDVKSQAAPPVEGKSDKQVVEQQDAGAMIHPNGKPDQTGGGSNAPGGSSGLQNDKPPGFADESMEHTKKGESPLGQNPHGEE